MAEEGTIEVRAFHYRDGVNFARGQNGNVIIFKETKEGENSEVTPLLDIDADSWISIVTSVGIPDGCTLRRHLAEVVHKA